MFTAQKVLHTRKSAGYYAEFTPTGNTLDTFWSDPNKANWPGMVFAQNNGDIQPSAPAYGGFGQPVYHYLAALNYTVPVETSEHFVEAVMSGSGDGGDYGMFLYIAGGTPQVNWVAMCYGFNSSTGSHGWIRRTGPGNANWTNANTWSNSPARPVVPVGGKCKVSVRKSGNDWVYEAWVNGVKISSPQATFTDVNGALHGVPGKYVGVGQWGANVQFNSYRGNNSWKGPIRIGDGQG